MSNKGKTKSNKLSWNYVFGNNYRTEIYHLCLTKSYSIQELQAILKLSHRTTLYHISILEKAGYVQVKKHLKKQGKPKEIISVKKEEFEKKDNYELTPKEKIDIRKNFANDYLYELSKAKEVIGLILPINTEESREFWINNSEKSYFNKNLSAHEENLKLIKLGLNRDKNEIPKYKPYFLKIEFVFQSVFDIKNVFEYIELIRSLTIYESFNFILSFRDIRDEKDFLKREYELEGDGERGGQIEIDLFYK